MLTTRMTWRRSCRRCSREEPVDTEITTMRAERVWCGRRPRDCVRRRRGNTRPFWLGLHWIRSGRKRASGVAYLPQRRGLVARGCEGFSTRAGGGVREYGLGVDGCPRVIPGRRHQRRERERFVLERVQKLQRILFMWWLFSVSAVDVLSTRADSYILQSST